MHKRKVQSHYTYHSRFISPNISVASKYTLTYSPLVIDVAVALCTTCSSSFIVIVAVVVAWSLLGVFVSFPTDSVNPIDLGTIDDAPHFVVVIVGLVLLRLPLLLGMVVVGLLVVTLEISFSFFGVIILLLVVVVVVVVAASDLPASLFFSITATSSSSAILSVSTEGGGREWSS